MGGRQRILYHAATLDKSEMSTEPPMYNTNKLVDKILATRPGFLASLPSHEIKVLGELIAIQKTSAFMDLTLLDAKDGATCFSARLPPDHSPPSLGYVVGVTGRLDVKCDGSTMEVFLQGSAFDQYPSHNHADRMACFARLLTQVKDTKLKKLAMPIRCIGLVTGPNTRAEFDFRKRIEHGPTKAEVKLFPVHLRNAADIADGINRAGENDEVDVIVITRGGGSPYDLHRFSQPQVLEAIATAVRRKFVLTAIGHTQDETLSDRLASYSETVPTAAAVYINHQYYEHKKKQVGMVEGLGTAAWNERVHNRSLISRARSWFRRWLRRTIIFTLGAIVGAFAGPPFLSHLRHKQAPTGLESTNGFTSSDRRFGNGSTPAKSGEARTTTGKRKPDKLAKPAH
jgi:hypothetical protein